jgi:Proteasome subunit
MTICIGVLASDAKAIVCVADRYISFGQEILGETDSVKIVPVGEHGAHALISGSDDAISRVLAKLTLSEGLGRERQQAVKYCEGAYQEAEREILEMRFLRPFMVAKDYEQALLKDRVNKVLKSIAGEIKKDRNDSENPTFSCGLILCGFDSNKEPYLLSLGPPGICTDATWTGFCATGSGSGYALQRLLSTEWKRKYPIDRALYETFDAKVQAENDMNVGYDWDAIVLSAERCVVVPEDIKVMIDRAWIQENRSPYEVFNKDEHKPLPPKDWKKKLEKYAESITPKP